MGAVDPASPKRASFAAGLDHIGHRSLAGTFSVSGRSTPLGSFLGMLQTHDGLQASQSWLVSDIMATHLDVLGQILPGKCFRGGW